MKRIRIVISLLASMSAAPAFLHAQSGGLEPADILKPLSDQWTSFSGDMTGKRYSSLKAINLDTVKNLSLKWANTAITTGCGPEGTGPAGGGGGRGAGELIVGGLGNGESNTCGPARFGGGMLFVDNTIYAATRDDVYSIDARDGSVLWHY